MLERCDGASFGLSDCEPMLECLAYFLSFCRGAWTWPMLLCGEDDAGEIIGKEWGARSVERFRPTYSWVAVTEDCYAQLHEAFLGYARLWFSTLWAEALRIVTQ